MAIGEIIGGIGALGSAAGGIIGGIQSGRAARRAADAARDAARDQLNLQNRVYRASQTQLAPYQQGGQEALFTLLRGFGLTSGQENPAYTQLYNRFLDANAGGRQREREQLRQQLESTPRYLRGTGQADPSVFQQDPGYQFRLNQGLQAIERSAAARGRLGSGSTVRAINDYASGTASQEFGNSFNRLAALAGIGQSATGQGAGLGQNYAAQAGNALQQAGQARASSYVGQANALNNIINQASGAVGALGPYAGRIFG